MRRKKEKMKLLVSLAVSLAVAPALFAANSKMIERGRYLVTMAGCNDCHSPKRPGTMAPDPARLLSGRPATTAAPAKPDKPAEISASGDLTAWYGPWGVSYAANLTPDPTTGIGKRYNEKSFIKTMRTGKKPDGTPLMPPMPWPDYANMSEYDLKSIWAFISSLKPVHNFVNSAAQSAVK
jgi:hypothetical protein